MLLPLVGGFRSAHNNRMYTAVSVFKCSAPYVQGQESDSRSEENDYVAGECQLVFLCAVIVSRRVIGTLKAYLRARNNTVVPTRCPQSIRCSVNIGLAPVRCLTKLLKKSFRKPGSHTWCYIHDSRKLLMSKLQLTQKPHFT
jgi:hypothetical protein